MYSPFHGVADLGLVEGQPPGKVGLADAQLQSSYGLLTLAPSKKEVVINKY